MAAEAQIERALKRFADSRGIWTRKFVSPSNRSVMDRIFAWDGLVLFLELKAPGKMPTDAQRDEINELAARRVMSTWVNNLEDGKMLLRFMLEGDEASIRNFMWEKSLC